MLRKKKTKQNNGRYCTTYFVFPYEFDYVSAQKPRRNLKYWKIINIFWICRGHSRDRNVREFAFAESTTTAINIYTVLHVEFISDDQQIILFYRKTIDRQNNITRVFPVLSPIREFDRAGCSDGVSCFYHLRPDHSLWPQKNNFKIITFFFFFLIYVYCVYFFIEIYLLKIARFSL